MYETSARIHVLDIESKSTKVAWESEEHIYCCRQLRDGTMAVGTEKQLLLFDREWKIIRRLAAHTPSAHSFRVSDIIQLRNGQIAVLVKGMEVHIWNEQCTKVIRHVYDIGFRFRMAELSPSVVCALGLGSATIVYDDGQMKTMPGWTFLDTLENGLLAVHSTVNKAISVYNGDALLYSVNHELPKVNAIAQVGPGIIAWENDGFVSLFNTYSREHIAPPRPCPGRVIQFLKE